MSSCSSDDNGLAITEENLLGKWYLKGGTVDNGAFQNYEHNCSTAKDFQEFFADGALAFNGYNLACEWVEEEISNWDLSGNTLTVTTNITNGVDDVETFIIEELSSNKLVLKQNVTSPEGEFVFRIHATRN